MWHACKMKSNLHPRKVAMLHSRGWIEIEWSTKARWLRQYSIFKTYIGPQGPKFGALNGAPRFIPGLEIKKRMR